MVFFVIALASFESGLLATECVRRAEMTTSKIAVQVYAARPFGDAVPIAATVSLIRSGRVVRTSKTDKRGYAVITPLPGRYSLIIEAPGTTPFSQDVIVGAKGVGTNRVLAVRLPGAMSCPTACEVSSAAPFAKPPACLFAPRKVTP
jgi:hypothetical protein